MNKKINFILLVSVCFLSGCFFLGCESSKVSPHEMIKKDKADEAKSVFTLQYDINDVDEDGNTVLHLAAEKNDVDLVTFFILKGADTELKNNAGDTPLHTAIKKGAVNAAETISTLRSASLFARDANDVTALDLGLKTDELYYDMFITTKAGELRDTEGQTIVHYFVKTKNLKAIKQCIKKSIPISVKDKAGKTPLDVAFENIDDIDAVSIAAELIMGGADQVETEFSYFQDAVAARNFNSRFDDGQTPLHLASIMGHSAIIKYLLQNNADMSAQDSTGSTPLHEAVRYGKLDIAEELLKAGADVNAKDNLGKTPAMIILPKDKVFDIYTLLIKYNANLAERDMFGDTALHTATLMDLDNNILSLLIEHGADIDARNREGVTPLTIAVQKEDIEAIKLFTEHGANIFTKDTHGNSPMTLALAGTPEVFEAVVNKKNVLTQDSDGNTPLHIALLSDAPLSKVQYIIALCDDVNVCNRDGNSALFIATLKNRQKVGEMLLAKKADIFATNTNNNSPLKLALKYGGSIQDWLITSQTIKATDSSGNSVLHYAAEWQFGDAIKNLLTKGADINARNANGETVLFSAAKTNNPEIIEIIVEGGADVHARDHLGSSALHTAVRWDAPESVNKLLSYGVNVDAQNSVGKSPLAEAVITDKIDMAKLLLDFGANPNSSDTNGVTVLADAIRSAKTESIKLLLDFGANPNVQAINGRNAYHEAATLGTIEIIDLIRNAGGNPLSRDKEGNTPFSIVIDKDIDVINAVLGNSYNITDSDGNTPVHIVVKLGGTDKLLMTLIKEGYPLDTRNAEGYTALNYAIEAGKISTALVLLENGANPFQMIDKKGNNGVTIALENNNKDMITIIVKYAGKKTDVQGNTILHYAAKSCDIETVKYLVSFGIDKSITNVSGDTAYTIAMRWKRPEIAELLK